MSIQLCSRAPVFWKVDMKPPQYSFPPAAVRRLLLLVSLLSVAPLSVAETRQAIFAGGCFWCMEAPFDKLEGVVSTVSGYIGGHVANPTYRQVTGGRTGHAEAVRVEYDPRQVTYEQLLQVFWRNIDPLDARGQFCDKGSQYRSGIFYLNESQRLAAQKSKDSLAASGRFRQQLVTEVSAAGNFYTAEQYHQDFYRKNPLRYRYYRARCGRDKRLAELWGEDRK